MENSIKAGEPQLTEEQERRTKELFEANHEHIKKVQEAVDALPDQIVIPVIRYMEKHVRNKWRATIEQAEDELREIKEELGNREMIAQLFII